MGAPPLVKRGPILLRLPVGTDGPLHPRYGKEVILDMQALLDRFRRYVKVDTTAVDETKEYPSSPGQIKLGKMLVQELKQLKLQKVSQDKHGIVTATVPGNTPGTPTIAWIAHLDTSPEASGKNVTPVVHKNYNGKDIVLPGDKSKVIRVADVEELGTLKGKTIITSDGTTLLGADDKAGVAIIMTAAAHLMANPGVKHGPIRVVFTCDEEVGRGTDKINLKEIGASAGYTLDGESVGLIENETFSADLATVTITGYNIHPGLAKGKMINAIRLAGLFLSRMPWQRLAPERTSDRDGFLHPYVLEGSVSEVKIKIVFRARSSCWRASVSRAMFASSEETSPKYWASSLLACSSSCSGTFGGRGTSAGS